MPRITSVATAVPPHRVGQTQARDFAAQFFRDSRRDLRRLLPVFDHSEIDSRYVCMPVEWFAEPHSFEEKNNLYIEWATELSAGVVRDCLLRAGVAPAALTHLIFVSTTGVATPSIDSRLINVLDLDPHIRRLPIWGLGCGGGAAGLAHAEQLALADPEARIMLVAVELCSLTFNHGDVSKSNLVATALFADGAAAVLVSGDDVGDASEADRNTPGSSGRPASLSILGSRSTTWPGSLDVMGWNFDSVGMQVVFSRDIPSIVRANVRGDMTSFLSAFELSRADLSHLIAHPGGVKVIEAYEEALDLEDGALAITRQSLRDHGNMSSASVLFVLERFFAEGKIAVGERAVLTALGPGFTAQNVLLGRS